MRIKIYFDNKRQYQRYRIISIFMVIASCLMVAIGVESEIAVPYIICTVVWGIWGRVTVQFFEDSEKQFKRYRNVFFFLTLAIILLAYWGVYSEILVLLCYFTLNWGLGFSKIILSHFGGINNIPEALTMFIKRRFNSKRQQKVFWVVMFSAMAISYIAGFFDETTIGKAIQHLGWYSCLFWLLFGPPTVRTILTDDKPKDQTPQ